MKTDSSRIFLVEDEGIIVMDLCDRLGALGYTVCGSAARGEKALQEIPAARPDVVLMDVHLAGKLNGIETAKRLRQVMDVPVVFLTAFSDPALLAQAGEAEPFGYLVKPFDERELHATLQMALLKHRTDRQLREANAQLEERVRERTEALELAYLQLIEEVGQRERADEMSAESNRRYRNLFEGSRDAIAVLDMGGMIIDCNAAFLQLTGYEELAEVSKLSYLDLTPAEYHAMEIGLIETQLMSRGYTDEYEKEYLRKDGARVAVSLRGVLRRDEDRQPVEMWAWIRDITQHKLIEAALQERSTALRWANEALRASDARRREAQRLARIGHWSLDRASGAMEWCDEAYDIFGRDAASFRPDRDTYYREIVHPADVAAVEREEQRAYDSGSQQRLDHRFLHGDGSVRWVHLEGIAEYDAAGLPSGLHGTMQDITERKQAEEKYRVILQSAIDGFWIADRGGRLLEANDAYCRMSGYSREELCRMHISDLDAEESPLDTARRIEEIRKLGHARFESRHRRKDGEIFAVEISVQYAAIGGGVYVTFVQDISQRKLAEEARRGLEVKLLEAQKRESEALLASIIDSTMDAIITVDEQQQVLVFNRAAEAMFRCAAADAIGRQLECFIPQRFRAIHAEHMQAYRASGTTARAMGQAGFAATLHALRSDGGEFPVEASISHVAVQGRELYSVVLRDITARVQAEATRHALEAQLRASQKMEAMGTLAGGIAHDFNNILAAILGNTALAKKDVSGGRDAEALVSLEEINKAGTRGKNLVQQILTFSRRQPQEMVIQPLAPLVAESLALLRATLPAVVSLEAALTENRLYVRADATQIGQVLMNLCTNAWHALKGSTGRIAVGLDGVRLDAWAAKRAGGLAAGDYARLTVSDTGCGMDEATLARIFEPFYTTKQVDQGTGLGLAVVHGIVQAHRGAINVSSAPGRGTMVEVLLPAVAAPVPATLPVAVAPAPTHGQGKHVLYVDDDEAMVFLVSRMLEDLGYRVSGFERGEAALEAVRAAPQDYDLVVTDFNMPGLPGTEVARELQRIRPDLPVVITTGYITEQLTAGAAAAGVRHVVYKPDTVAELCETIERLLEGDDV
jgi:two-component system, cell cycle sensor histidine kinase and response regulator CckA